MDVGDHDEPVDHLPQRPPSDQHHDGDDDHRPPAEQEGPVVQRGGEAALQTLGQAVHVGQPPPLREARHERRDAFDVGGHRFEDQVAQPDQDRQRRHHGCPEHRARHEPDGEDRQGAATTPQDEADEQADVGAVDHRHEAAHSGDQERDRGARDRRGDQHPNPEPVDQQAHRHGAQQRYPGGERHHDRDDGGGRTQRGHHRGVRQLDGLQRTSPPSLARAAGRSHFTILPVAAK